MKRIILLFALLLEIISLPAQNRRYMSSYQSYPSYFNAAMTGFSGNTIHATYRSSHWIGFEGAPKTYFISSDLTLKRHGFGIAFLHDSFGPYRESELHVNYGYHINLSKKLKLRAGAAATLNTQRVDMSALEMNAQNDPAFQDFAQNFNNNIQVDFNIGMALTGNNFYVGYSLQNATQGALVSEEDYFNRAGYFHHVAQAGLRMAFSNRFGMVVNGLYRYDPTFLHTTEVQVKTVIRNAAWIGIGYRSETTCIGLIGFRVKQIQVGYAYELPGQRSTQANTGTSELILSYQFKTPKNKLNKQAKKPNPKSITIW